MGSTTYCICDLLGSMDGLIIYSPHEPPPTVRYARWTLIRQVRFTRNHDPDPAIASRKQHDKRRYRLEFKIHTYQYAPG